MTQSEGFTLLEALIAMFVLSIGVLAFYSMHIQAITGNKVSNAITGSASTISDLAEQLYPKSYSHSDLEAGTHTFSGTLPTGVESITWSVVEWDSDGIDNDLDGVTDESDEQGVKEVTYTTTYNNRGNDRNISIRFLKTRIL